MSTIFPSSPTVGQQYGGYEWNGTAWRIVGIDLTQDYATQSELDAHSSDTTSVHGISNTASIVLTNDSRLSDRIPLSTIDAKGDILAGLSDNTISKISIGIDGQILTADSSQGTGIKWSNAPDTGIHSFLMLGV